MDTEVIDVGFVSDAQDSAIAAETLRAGDCDLIVIFVTTYLTSSMVLPIAHRSKSPVLVIDLQSSARVDHAGFDTGAWLAYCSQCPVPEIGNVFLRAVIQFRSVSDRLRQQSAWQRIERWVAAAHFRIAPRYARHGLRGHLYPGRLDVSSDLTLLSTTFGSHVETLEFDDLRLRIDDVSKKQVPEQMNLAREISEIDANLVEVNFVWGAKVSVCLDQLVENISLNTLSHYHRWLNGELLERIGADRILGASLLTAQLATIIVQAGGSFSEIQSLNFEVGVVGMGYDDSAHLSTSPRDSLLRGLGIHHGKRGRGLSVEANVQSGPVTPLSLGQNWDGSLTFVGSERRGVSGLLLQVVTTTSRIDFDHDPGHWVDDWSATGIGHHRSSPMDHRAANYAAVVNLLDIGFHQVRRRGLASK